MFVGGIWGREFGWEAEILEAEPEDVQAGMEDKELWVPD
jgi:hypothetical protein